jgi:crotonobetainyl-CoA:carnitine CoA-transferase CaiB-like acyl-CoA transferase
VIYVSNCGFGHTGPYHRFKTWGPIVQAVSGLTFTSTLPGQPPAGWGYSYMDHTGGYYMAMAVMLALIHRQRTGEGQWVDLACTESGLTLHGPALLDWTVNGRPTRQEIQPSSNRSQWPPMAPHGIYPCAGDDQWVAIACRSDADWQALGGVVGESWCREPGWAEMSDRVADQDRLDGQVAAWTNSRDKFEVARALLEAGVAAAAVQTPEERIDHDTSTGGFGLWPTVTHSKMGPVRIDGLPVHFSATDWHMSRGAPCLGEHTGEVLERLLGLSADEVARLRQEGVI